MELVIMAAGMGSRFGGLKQVEPMDKNGNFLLDYSIFDAIKVGFDKVVFVIKAENYDLFRQTVGKRIEGKIKVEYVFQDLNMLPKGYSAPKDRVKPWGTSHAILCCKNVVKSNFAIINADDFYGFDAFKVMAEFLKNAHYSNRFTHFIKKLFGVKDVQHYALVGYKCKNTVSNFGSTKRGVCKDENGKLINIVESNVETEKGKYYATPLDGGKKSEISGETIVSMNMLGFTPYIFEFLEKSFVDFLEDKSGDVLKKEFLIPMTMQETINVGLSEVAVLKTNAVWHGVTYKEDKPEVVSAIKQLVKEGKYPENLWG